MKPILFTAAATAVLAFGVAAAQPGPKADTDGDGNVTRAEALSMAETMFANLDADADGFVSKAEMKDARHMMRKSKTVDRKSGERRGSPMEKLDTDGDGKLSESEMAGPDNKKFEKLDADGDGYVTEAEMTSAREDMKKKRGEWRVKRRERMEKRWALLDTDGDGKASKAEMMAQAEARFSKADANGDGVITADERPSRQYRGERSE